MNYIYILLPAVLILIVISIIGAFKRHETFTDYKTPQLYQDKVILITGSTQGIGKALAKHIVKAGGNVIVNGRYPDTVKDVAREVGSATGIAADISKPHECKRMMKEIRDRFGRLDILINNAVYLSGKPLLDMDMNEWDKEINTNISGVMYLSQLALTKDSVMVVNISSSAANITTDSSDQVLGSYVIAKSAMNKMTEVLAKEVRGDSVVTAFQIDGPVKYTETMHMSDPVSLTIDRVIKCFDQLMDKQADDLNGRIVSTKQLETEAGIIEKFEERGIALKNKKSTHEILKKALEISSNTKIQQTSENGSAPVAKVRASDLQANGPDLEDLSSDLQPLDGTNPLGSSPLVTLEGTSDYPSKDQEAKLVNKIAEMNAVDTNNICLFPGTLAAIETVASVCMRPGASILFGSPGWEPFQMHMEKRGYTLVPIPYKPTRDEDMLKAMTNEISTNASISMVYLTSPQFPSGRNLTASVVADFVEALPRRVVCVIDQCYLEYADDSVFNGIQLLDHHNVVIARSLSKFYGLASMRVSYTITNPVFTKAFQSYNTNPFLSNYVIDAALSTLGDMEYHKRVFDTNLKERKRITRELGEKKVKIIEGSQANYVLADAGSTSISEIRSRLKKEGYASMQNSLFFDRYYMIMIQKRDANNAQISVLL